MIQLMCLSSIKLLFFHTDLKLPISCAIIVVLLHKRVQYQNTLPSKNEVDVHEGKHLDSLLVAIKSD